MLGGSGSGSGSSSTDGEGDGFVADSCADAKRDAATIADGMSSGMKLDDVDGIRGVKKYVFFCVACAALNSVILGYDIGVSGGALLEARDELNMVSAFRFPYYFF